MKKAARVFFCVSVFFVFVFISGETRLRAAPGDLDQTFGVEGRRIVLIPNSQPNFMIWNTAQDIVVQPDGKILVGPGRSYDSNIVRLNPDGTKDTAFSALCQKSKRSE